MPIDPGDEEDNEPYDGDWCLVDLGEPITEEATKVAHALGLSFEQFMNLALEEKLAPLRSDEELMRAVKDVCWEPTLKGTVEMAARDFSDHPDRIFPRKKRSVGGDL